MYIAFSRRSIACEEIAHWRERAGYGGPLWDLLKFATTCLADIVVWALYDRQFSLVRELLAGLSTSEATGADHFVRMQVASALITAGPPAGSRFCDRHGR
jgi:hypothetical protein